MTLPSVLRYATEQQVCWINFLCSLNIWTIHKVDPSHMLDFSTASDHQKIPHLLSYCTRLRCKFQRSMTLHYIPTTVSDPSETFSSVDWPTVNAFVAGRSQNISGIVSLWSIFLTVKINAFLIAPEQIEQNEILFVEDRKHGPFALVEIF